MKRALVGVAVAALLLTGCSSASSATGPSSAPASASPTPSSSGPVLGPVSSAQKILADAVAKVGCTEFYLGSPPAPAVDAWGPCLLGKSSITFYVVSSAANEKNFLTLITNFGLDEKQIVKAPSLLVAVDDPAQVEHLRKALNG